MELSKMFGVERGEIFRVNGLMLEFVVDYNTHNYEYLKCRIIGNTLFLNIPSDTLFRVIAAAPAGIIHLPPPLTDEQREQLKALYTLGYRWLAKDGNGVAYAYDKQKLAKGLTIWLSQKGGCSRIHDGMAEDVIIPLVSWSDPEPYDIGKALGVGE